MTNNNITEKLFFQLLPIQILVIAMGALNSIVDGAVAGQYIDAATVGVIGLYYTMVNVLNAIGNTLLGGTAVLCGRSMGAGDVEKTNGIFSLNIFVTFCIGTALTLISFCFSGPIADLLGASKELRPALVLYIIGYAIGILPQLLAQQLASFLQLERQNRRGYVGVASMICTNVVLDLLLVAVFRLGIFGLALATSLSSWVYLIILGQYYFTKHAQLNFRFRSIEIKMLHQMILIGAPGALLVFCLALRSLVLNRILLTYTGNDGLSAMAAYNMVSGLILSYSLGVGAVVRILTSVYVGERDSAGIRSLFRVVFTKGMAITLVLTVLIVLSSGGIAQVFFPDTASSVYRLSRQLLMIYSASIPMIIVCCFCTNYLQARGHHLFVNFLSVFDGFISNIVPSLLLAPLMGALGIWIAGPIGIFLTMIMTPLYCVLFWRRRPASLDEWLFIQPGFDVDEQDRLSIAITTDQEVANTAEKVQAFCKEHGMSEKAAYYTALCLEEMTGNIVSHGFYKDHKRHSVDARIIYRDGGAFLRIKDDCIPFNPKERAEITDPADPLKNIGIRMVMRLADEVSYHNMLGLNVLTMELREHPG